MKKNYITPIVEIHLLNSQEVLSSVSDSISSSNGVGYGGVDEEGELDPSSRRRGTSDSFDPTEEVTADQRVWEQGLW